jgi:hypothetical protein
MSANQPTALASQRFTACSLSTPPSALRRSSPRATRRRARRAAFDDERFTAYVSQDLRSTVCGVSRPAFDRLASRDLRSTVWRLETCVRPSAALKTRVRPSAASQDLHSTMNASRACRQSPPAYRRSASGLDKAGGFLSGGSPREGARSEERAQQRLAAGGRRLPRPVCVKYEHNSVRSRPEYVKHELRSDVPRPINVKYEQSS